MMKKLVAAQRKTLDPGFRRDDGGNFKVGSITKPGIQCLWFTDLHQAKAQPPPNTLASDLTR